MLSLIQLLSKPNLETGRPVLLATFEQGNVCGVALRSGDNRDLICTRMPDTACDLIGIVGQKLTPKIAGLNGPEQTVNRIAGSVGANLRLKMKLGIYSCTKVIPPQETSGHFRVAEVVDLPIILQWNFEFSAEALNDPTPLTPVAKERLLSKIQEQKLFLWCNPEPISQVYAAGETPNGIRITGVYTPLSARGRGFASACTAATTQKLLDSGHKLVFLYTDMTNPTSNKIYQKIGYIFSGISISAELMF